MISTVDTLLHHTTSMFVASNLYTLLDHGIIDELVELRLPCEENLLNHMVSIDVLGKLPNLFFQA